MSKIICAVCNNETTEHGDGMKVPKTTCLYCYERRLKINKADKEMRTLKRKENN